MSAITNLVYCNCGVKLVQFILEDKNVNLWIGTNNKVLNRFNAATQTFIRFINDPKNLNNGPVNDIHVITEGPRGQLWLNTHAVLFLSEPKIGMFQLLKMEPSKNQNTSISKVITGTLQSHNGTQWIANLFNGLSRYDLKTNSFTYYQHNPGDARSLGNYRICAL